MKTRFTTVDLKSIIHEIQNSKAMGLRLFNVYDIDNKTYLLRLTHGEIKIVILIESGNRIHKTDYNWPKNMMPSGFSMKCRKHLKGRRLASVEQLGIDRIVDFTFGYDEAAYHLIVELYDRGNIILTDYTYQVLQLLRNRTDADKDVKFAVRELYPVELARQYEPLMSKEKLKELLLAVKPGENLKRALNPLFVFGPALLEHCLLESGLKPNSKLIQQFDPENDEEMDKLMIALADAETILNSEKSNGYIIQKKEQRVKTDGAESEVLLTYTEFHPYLYTQHKHFPHVEFPSFNKSVDEFFSKLEGQKFEMKTLQIEKSAVKRLENVKQDHENRLKSLKESQDEDLQRADLIELNLPLVERAIATINSAIANQIDWEEINEIVQEAKSAEEDPVAMAIKSLKLETNHIVLSLRIPYKDDSSSEEEENETRSGRNKNKNRATDILIDLGLTAFANARSIHDKRRNAASKEQKTIQASKKALKSAEQKTKETLKAVQTSKLISKTRKTYWFEKFYWFISSENYLVIGGRDQQQNELIVKRYLKAGDLYVHADLHGASSVILKNPTGDEVPPKTLNEAGSMAICYSAAWDARVVTSAWWVHHNQVSKTAPSGEYLTTGSFMIRGKKNYLPPTYLVMGFSIIFKLDESCISAHVNDRKVRLIEDEVIVNEIANEEDEVEIELNDDDDEDINEIDNKENNVQLNSSLSSPSSDVSPVEADVNMESELNKLNIKDEENKNEKIDDQEEENLFPDTNIQLQHISGETFQLHRGVSATSSHYDENEEHDDDYVYLGDGERIKAGKQQPENRKIRLSAKQRRDMKKKNKQPNTVNEEEEENIEIKAEVLDENSEKNKIQNNDQKPKPPQQQQQQQRTRAQKSKQKKINNKYKDQDDEDRELMQQILRSNEPERPPKKKGKALQKEKQQLLNKEQQKKHNQKKLQQSDNQPVILHREDDQPLIENVTQEKEAEDDADDLVDELEKENVSLLDSLTGCPLDDDILLYAIPVCAPYTCLQSYKYKVKLTPGTGKRGKAAKTAINMFQVSKETKDWERDLLKALKDLDISRNIPGKVKLSAPNLHQKGKKKK